MTGLTGLTGLTGFYGDRIDRINKINKIYIYTLKKNLSILLIMSILSNKILSMP